MIWDVAAGIIIGGGVLGIIRFVLDTKAWAMTATSNAEKPPSSYTYRLRP
jgi:hypothetical protein